MHITPSSVRFSLIFGTLLITIGCGTQIPITTAKISEAWMGTHNPARLGASLERDYTLLPSKAQLETLPWPGSYYPSCKGSIGKRKDADAWSYRPHTLAELQGMSTEDILKLSPAEKIDIALGKFNYPLLGALKKEFSADNPYWWGICDGWSAASFGYKEPLPIIYKAKNGLTIPFSTADIKALLIYNQSYYGWDNSAFSGVGVTRKCDVDLTLHPEKANDPDCKGINAASFHLILTNFIGKLKKGFVADLSRTSEVWNFPIYGYSFAIQKENPGASPGAARGTVKEILVNTEVYFRTECDSNCNDLDNGSGYKGARKYIYKLEIDAQNRIIGGTWESEERPSYLWLHDVKTFKNGEYAKEIGKIYNLSLSLSIPEQSRWQQFCKASASPAIQHTISVLKDYLGEKSCVNTYKKLFSVSELNLDGKNITNLEPLSEFINLKIISLDSNQIKDISPIKYLVKLEALSLSNNQIKDIEPLENLTELKHLKIENNEISDLTHLQSLTKLQYLTLSSNKIKDVTPLKGLTELYALELSKNELSDISPLSHLIKLTALTLDHNQIKDISALQKLTNLYGLTVEFNQISDVTPMQTLAELKVFAFANNPIIDK